MGGELVERHQLDAELGGFDQGRSVRKARVLGRELGPFPRPEPERLELAYLPFEALALGGERRTRLLDREMLIGGEDRRLVLHGVSEFCPELVG